MKKIMLVLMFSLGLVSVANAESVCSDDKEVFYKDNPIRALVDGILGSNITPYSSDGDWKLNKEAMKMHDALYNLMVSYHSKEFKIDNKESICVYMNVIDLSFLNTQLTQDDIEQFERYMAEKGEYEKYAESKEYYLLIAKFFKYYRNYLPSIHQAKELIGLEYLKDYRNTDIKTYKYVYGKRQREYSLDRYASWGEISGEHKLEGTLDEVKNNVATYTTNCKKFAKNYSQDKLNECQKNKNILSSIVQWAESNMKQKGGQK